MFYSATTIWNGSMNSLSVAGSTFSGHDNRVGEQETDRNHLEVLELTGDNGNTLEWRFQPTYAAKAPYIVRLPGRGIYQATLFNFMTSTQVAERVAKWAGVKPLHCSYEVYVEMGRHDLAKP